MNKNPRQAGYLAMKLFFEDHGYTADPLPNNEWFHMGTPVINTGDSYVLPASVTNYHIGSPIQRNSDKIVLWGVTAGMKNVPLEGKNSAGAAIRAFDSSKGGQNEFLSKSERQYTHFAIIYESEKRVLLSTLA